MPHAVLPDAVEEQDIDERSYDGGRDCLGAARHSDGVDGDEEAADDPHDGDKLGAHLDGATAATRPQPKAHDLMGMTREVGTHQPRRGRK